MIRLTRLLVLAALVVAGCAAPPVAAPTVGAPSSAAGSLPREVSVAQADALRADGALVVDVREPSEWATGVIPGASLISLGDLAARGGELPRDRAIVVVCRSGNRSAQGRDILLGAGFTAVTSMAGGMAEWVGSGLPTSIP